MKKFDILVNNGYNYEYAATVEATTWRRARIAWMKRCAPSQRDFKVVEVKA